MGGTRDCWSCHAVLTMQDHLDAMAWAKMNVFHWHLMDDQSFPWQTDQLPELSRQGAFSKRHTYTSRDVAGIIAYAKDRGVRVIPELDTPGHTASWGKGYPELLTQCYDEQGMPNGQLGPLDPTRNSTYNALWLLFREAAQVFPDSYLHLGGDEVPFDCWQSNPDVQDWMRANSLGSLSQLETYFESRVLDLATLAGRSYIVWQDVLDNNVTLKPDTVVHVWKWWPVGSTVSTGRASQASLSHSQSSHATPAASSSPSTGRHADQLSSQQSSQRSSQQPRHQSQGPRGCKLSRGCPGEVGSYSAGEEPGWFPEMEKVTAQVIPGLHTQWLVTQSTALHASETPVTSVFILPRTWRSPKHHAVGLQNTSVVPLVPEPGPVCWGRLGRVLRSGASRLQWHQEAAWFGHGRGSLHVGRVC
ncbi:hypothetical protein ABBQ32_010536 [Trebouxia sp. C0010 RCD-2024]